MCSAPTWTTEVVLSNQPAGSSVRLDPKDYPNPITGCLPKKVVLGYIYDRLIYGTAPIAPRVQTVTLTADLGGNQELGRMVLLTGVDPSVQVPDSQHPQYCKMNAPFQNGYLYLQTIVSGFDVRCVLTLEG